MVLKLPSSITRFLKIFPRSSTLSISNSGITIAEYFQQATYPKDKDFQSSSSETSLRTKLKLLIAFSHQAMTFLSAA
jgi:hypothetical protein